MVDLKFYARRMKLAEGSNYALFLVDDPSNIETVISVRIILVGDPEVAIYIDINKLEYRVRGYLEKDVLDDDELVYLLY